MRFLAVDDEKYPLIGLCRAIEQAVPGAEVDAFSSSSEALDAVKGKRYDVVFTDIHMPGLHGIDFARAIKKINPMTSIVFVSGYDSIPTEDILFQSNGYVTKPVMEKDIRAQLEHFAQPAEIPPSEFFARTFGEFDFFVKGVPLVFRHEKSKEILAYLIDLEGKSIPKKQLIENVFGTDVKNFSHPLYMEKLLKSLTDDLRAVSAGRILRHSFGNYSVDPTAFDCDAYSYFRNDIEAVNHYRGEYMRPYSWGETNKEKFLA